MSYTNIQFIGYSIDTAPLDGATPKYLGLADPTADILARCELMKRAITAACDNLPATSSPPSETILKVFMAPEFYLRGDQGAYEMDDVQTAIATLQALVADDRWADWLFVFGTILGVSDPAHPPMTQEIYNFALIQQGGFANSGSKGARVVMKELKSDIDFIAEYPYAGGLLLGQVNPPQAGPSGPGRERQVTYDGGGIFDLTDLPITFAMDICLDHLDYRMVNSPQLPGDYQVQVQLVPSCGADIDPTAVVAELGGYVFNVDGHNGSHAVLKSVVQGGGRVIRPLGTYPVDGSAITVDGVSPPVIATIDDLYRDGPGEIVIFGPQAIPPRTSVPGDRVQLPPWNVPGGYQFNFEIVVDGAGKFITIVCGIASGKVNFGDRQYFLPLDLRTRDTNGEDVRISMRLIQGGGYDHAVWCHIETRDFDFEGPALQFNNNNAPQSPPQPLELVW